MHVRQICTADLIRMHNAVSTFQGFSQVVFMSVLPCASARQHAHENDLRKALKSRYCIVHPDQVCCADLTYVHSALGYLLRDSRLSSTIFLNSVAFTNVLLSYHL